MYAYWRFIIVVLTSILSIAGWFLAVNSNTWIQEKYIEPYVQSELNDLQTSLHEYIKKALVDVPSQEVVETESISGLTPVGATENITTIIKEITTISSPSALPTGDTGSTLYLSSDGWKAGTQLYTNGTVVGVGTKDPRARLHVISGDSGTIGLMVQGAQEQNVLLMDLRDFNGNSLANFSSSGKLTITQTSNDHSIELIPSGNAGYLSSNGGALYINNTNNMGSGIGIFSNAGADALGNMINIKVDNPLYNQAAFYMNYDGLSNAVEIISNTEDSSSNALSITNNNTSDSALGVIGYETGKGTIKVSHNGTGTDSNASGLSIDLKGTGTRAQGLYVDSTASSGTLGNLLRLRNQSIDRFVVNSAGSLSMGVTGTNTSITKHGNVDGDEFFVGTTGAFRVQRSATASEAFRVQVNGDAQGRWLGTSDGQLKWGDGATVQDVVLRRSGASTLMLDDATFQITSRSTNTDLTVWTAADNSRLGRFLETSGGAGWFEIADAAGATQIVLRADGGSSYINTGNFGIGTSSFGTGASKVLALGNGVAPSTSITDGIQLYAIDADDSDGTATSELFVRDEDGNATNLSPHNFSLLGGPSESLAWSYYSERDGRAINVDMARAIRIIEQLSGIRLIYKRDLATGNLIDEPLSLSSLSSSPLQQVISPETQVQQELENTPVPELKEYVGLSGTIIEIFKNLIVKTKAVFQDSVEFLASVVFRDNVTFEKDVTVQGNVNLNKNQIGKAVIKTGQKEVRISLSYTKEPIITVTPGDNMKGTYWVKKSGNGFSIYLSDAQDHDIVFDWHVFSGDVQTAESENSPSREISDPEEKPVITVESPSASIAGVASESAN